jgi:hypothetical protein
MYSRYETYLFIYLFFSTTGENSIIFCPFSTIFPLSHSGSLILNKLNNDCLQFIKLPYVLYLPYHKLRGDMGRQTLNTGGPGGTADPGATGGVGGFGEGPVVVVNSDTPISAFVQVVGGLGGDGPPA